MTKNSINLSNLNKELQIALNKAQTNQINISHKDDAVILLIWVIIRKEKFTLRDILQSGRIKFELLNLVL